MQAALIAFEEVTRSVARAAHGEVEDIEPLRMIAAIEPEPARSLDLPLRVAHLHRCVIGVDCAGHEDQRLHEVVQRLEKLGGAAHPVAERRSRDFHALPGQPTFLAMERNVVNILVGDHMSQESRTGQTLGNRLRGLAGGDDLTLAVRAGVRAAHMFDDEQRRRLVIELLAALSADLGSGPTALGTAALGFGQIVDDRDTREILGRFKPPFSLRKPGNPARSSHALPTHTKSNLAHDRQFKRWPKGSNALSNAIRKVSPSLRENGISVAFPGPTGHSRSRQIEILSIPAEDKGKRSCASSREVR